MAQLKRIGRERKRCRSVNDCVESFGCFSERGNNAKLHLTSVWSIENDCSIEAVTIQYNEILSSYYTKEPVPFVGQKYIRRLLHRCTEQEMRI